MKKLNRMMLFSASAVFLLSGCQSKKEEPASDTKETAAQETEAFTDDAAEFSDDVYEFDFMEETEEQLEPIDPSSYFVENLSDHVTLANVGNLAATEYVRAVTDEDVHAFIEEELLSSGVDEEVSRPAQMGDMIYAEVTSTVQGSNTSVGPDTYYMCLGNADISEAFDEAMTGMSAGDQKSFALTFDDSVWVEEWADQTVKFDVTVSSVMVEQIPEYNDTYVAEYTEYESMQEYEDAIRTRLESEYDYANKQDVYEDLLNSANEHAVYSVLPVDLVRVCKDEILNGYLSLLDEGSDANDVAEIFGYTESQMTEDAKPIAQRRLLVQAICEKYNITATSEEYFTYLAEQAKLWGGCTSGEYERSNSRSAVVWGLYEQKAARFLYLNADITSLPYSEKAEDNNLVADENVVDVEFDDAEYEDETGALTAF